jgi:hypothetical protein
LRTIVELPDATSPDTTVPAPAGTAALNGPQSVNVVAVLPRQMTEGFAPTAIVAGILKYAGMATGKLTVLAAGGAFGYCLVVPAWPAFGWLYLGLCTVRFFETSAIIRLRFGFGRSLSGFLTGSVCRS